MVQAEADSVLYGLSVEAYQRLKAENPSLHQALLTCGDGRTAKRRKKSDRCVAPLEARERITQQRQSIPPIPPRCLMLPWHDP
jgi:hypothetical protein